LAMSGLFGLTAFAVSAERYFKPVVGEFKSDLIGMERLVTGPDGGIRLYTNAGRLVSGYPLFVDGVVVTSPVLGNIDGVSGDELIFIARNSSGQFTLYVYSANQILLVSSVLNAGAVYYDPVIIDKNIFVAQGDGKIYRLSYSAGALQSSLILDVGQVVGLSFQNGSSLILNYPQKKVLEVYNQSGGNWVKSKTFNLNNAIVYPVLVGNGYYYGIDSSGRLISVNQTSGLELTGVFPVKFHAPAVGSPYWAEYDSANVGYELVLPLNDGAVALVSQSGQILSDPVFESKKYNSYNNSSFDVLGNGFFVSFGYDGGQLLNQEQNTFASSLGLINFPASSTINGQPQAVNNVQANYSANKITVSWDKYLNLNDFDHFNIYRANNTSTMIDGASLLATVNNKTGISFQDSLITVSTTYYYAVRAVNALGLQSNNDWIGPVSYINRNLDPYTVLNLKLNDSATGTAYLDSSNYANNGVCMTGLCPALGYTGVSGTSAYFAGNGEHIRVSSSESLKITDAVSVEAWIKPEFNSVTEASQVIVNKRNDYELGTTKDARLYAGITNASNTRKIVKSKPGALIPNVWSHVAMTYNGSVISLFVNGNQVASESFSGVIKVDDILLLIGQFQGHYYYKGLLDNLKIYNVALTKSEIMALAGNNISTDYALNLKLDEPFLSMNFSDSSGYANNGVCMTGLCPALGYIGVSSTSAYFAGNGEHIRVSSSESLKITDAIILEAWIKPTLATSTDNYQDIINKRNDYELGIYRDGRIQAGITNASGTRKLVSSSAGSVVADNWNYVAMTYDGSLLSIYANGSVIATSSFSGLINSTDILLLIGQFQGSYYYQGYMDEVAIYSKVLSDSEILANYNKFKP